MISRDGTQISGSTGPILDGSGTCTGATQQVFAANTNRQYLFIENTGTTNLYVDFGVAATTTSGEEVLPGGTLIFETNFIPSEAVNVIGTSTQPFVAKQA